MVRKMTEIEMLKTQILIAKELISLLQKNYTMSRFASGHALKTSIKMNQVEQKYKEQLINNDRHQENKSE